MRYSKIKPPDQTEQNQKKTPPRGRWLTLGKLALSFVVIYGGYQAGLNYQFKPIVYLYFGALLILLCVFLVMNRGFDRESPTPDMLPDAWSEEKKAAYIKKDKELKKKARVLLYFIFPLLITFMIDLLYLAFTMND